MKKIWLLLLVIGGATLCLGLGFSHAKARVFDAPHTQATFTQRLSIAANDVQANGPSFFPSISSDGERVAFLSTATNLTGATLNGRAHVLVKERSSGAVRLASISDGGAQADANARDARISGNGRFVVFSSAATNLAEGMPAGIAQVYVRDLQLERTVLISRSAAGAAGHLDALQPDISADGRYVVFASAAGNLTVGDFNGRSDIFLYDRDADGDGILDEAGVTSIRVLSLGAEGEVANGFSGQPVISDSGRFVAFESAATNLHPTDTNGLTDIFLHDRDFDNDGVYDEAGGTFTHLISQGHGGSPANGDSTNPAISGDGLSVAFESFADNVLADGTAALRKHIFVRNWQGGSTALMSISTEGEESNQWSENPVLSTTGRYTLFESTGDNLVEGDSNFGRDIFLRDRDADGDGVYDEPGQVVTRRVSLSNSDSQMLAGQAYHPDISGTGELVVFDADAVNLVSQDSNGVTDVFLRRWNGELSPLAVDLALSLTGRTAVLGQATTVTVTLVNRGPEPAVNARVAFQADSRGYLSISQPSKGSCDWRECLFNTVGVSETVTIPLTVAFFGGGDSFHIGSMSVRVEAVSAGSERNPADNILWFDIDYYNCSDAGNGCVLDELFCALYDLWIFPLLPSRSSFFLPDLALYYQVRDQLMSSSADGRRYTSLYYAHSSEIAQMVFTDAALKQQMLDGLQAWEPSLQALVDGNGESAIITAQQVTALDEFLGALSAAGSPALQEAIAAEREKLPALDSFAGKTMDEARQETVGYGVTLPLIQNP